MINSVISQRLSFPISAEENRYFNPLKFVDKSGNVLFELPERHTDQIYKVPGDPKIGKAHIANDSLVQGPMDFTYKNKFPLSELHSVIQRIIFPYSFSEAERFHISEGNREFILKYMSTLPRESDYPSYPQPEYYDSYCLT